MIRAPRALNVGALLVLLALLLAFAAGTLGLGPDRPVRDGYFEPPFYTTHGGAVGEALYWASTTLFQRLGAQILAILMLLSGVLLLTGMTIANLVANAGGAARKARDTTRVMARTVRQPGSPPAGWAEPEDADIQITRADETGSFETEPLSHEPVWDDDVEEAESDEPDQAPNPETGTHAAFSYDESSGVADDTPPAVNGNPGAQPAPDPDGPGRGAESRGRGSHSHGQQARGRDHRLRRGRRTWCRSRSCSRRGRTTPARTRATAS